MMGEKPKQFIFVAVEKSPPFVTKCWTIAERDIDAQFTSIGEGMSNMGQVLVNWRMACVWRRSGKDWRIFRRLDESLGDQTIGGEVWCIPYLRLSDTPRI